MDEVAIKLRALAPGKVNLSLFLGGTRQDGRHRLVTVFESLSLADTLELETLAAGAADEVVCPGVEGENLAARALAALRERGWDGPPARVTIGKRIPVAAGMAGGSADAAAALRLASALAPGRPEEIETIAAHLGADVPGQLLPGLSVGTGAGEVVEHFAPLGEHACVVVPSARFALPTPEVFREADRLGLRRSDSELDELYALLVGALTPNLSVADPPVAAAPALPDALVVNDLQPAAISLCPWCDEALADLRAAGARHAIVSGSGPTVVGIWWGEGAATEAAQAREELAARHPQAVVAEPVDSEYAAASFT